jgi:hypothetical protein
MAITVTLPHKPGVSATFETQELANKFIALNPPPPPPPPAPAPAAPAASAPAAPLAAPAAAPAPAGAGNVQTVDMSILNNIGNPEAELSEVSNKGTPMRLDAMIKSGRLTQEQLEAGSLPNIMTLFESAPEYRDEFAYLLQRFVFDGFMRGVDIPKLIRENDTKLKFNVSSNLANAAWDGMSSGGGRLTFSPKLINPNRDARSVMNVFYHELGHEILEPVTGLGHGNAGGGIMEHMVPGPNTVTNNWDNFIGTLFNPGSWQNLQGEVGPKDVQIQPTRPTGDGAPAPDPNMPPTYPVSDSADTPETPETPTSGPLPGPNPDGSPIPLSDGSPTGNPPVGSPDTTTMDSPYADPSDPRSETSLGAQPSPLDLSSVPPLDTASVPGTVGLANLGEYAPAPPRDQERGGYNTPPASYEPINSFDQGLEQALQRASPLLRELGGVLQRGG